MEELETLSAIYEVDFKEDLLKISTNYGDFYLGFQMPADYPQSKPELKLKMPNLFNTTEQIQWEKSILELMEEAFRGIFIPGEPVLFDFIEWAKEFLDQLEVDLPKEQPAFVNDSREEPAGSIVHSEDGFVVLEGCPKIYHSKVPLIEKKSVFIAHCAIVSSLEDVKLVHKTLLSNSKVAKATHNISAYRIVQSDGVIRQDSDDDGETAAGGRLLHLLQLVEAKNVYVVVSRWYGGIQLGPARFKFINNCARQLLVESNIITT